MSNAENEKSPAKSGSAQKDELSDRDLDGVAGGQGEILKMDPIVVTAKRVHAAEPVVKLDPIIVTAKREQPGVAGAQIATAGTSTKKD